MNLVQAQPRPAVARGAGLLALLVLVAPAARADALTAGQIVERVHAAAGGPAWLAAGTNVMRGHATLCRDGDPGRCVHADRYEMFRVYPTELRHGAHAGSGKFRLDAYVGGKVLFQVAFDGERSYDQVEGHPCYFVRVTDPTGTRTLFGIDQATFAVRSAGWQTPRGFHQRLYSEFYRVGDFLQPGRVRHYYDGVLGVDIHWTSAEIGQPLADGVFVLGPSVESGR